MITPVQTPALKMPAIASQLDKVVTRKAAVANRHKENLFITIFLFVIQYNDNKAIAMPAVTYILAL